MRPSPCFTNAGRFRAGRASAGSPRSILAASWGSWRHAAASASATVPTGNSLSMISAASSGAGTIAPFTMSMRDVQAIRPGTGSSPADSQ